MEDSFKLYNRFVQEHPTGVFLITRDCDAKMFMYIAQRQTNTLVGEKVRCMAVMAPDYHLEQPIHEVVLNNFFRLKLNPVPGSSKHEACMAAFPERFMMLHLKKNSTESKNDGHVTATTTFALGKQKILVHNVQLLSMKQIMTFDELEIPDLQRVYLYGCVNLENMKHVSPELFTEYCKPISATQCLIHEIVEITPEMRKRFDVKALAAQWFMSKAKLT